MSKIGYFTAFALPPWFQGPAALHVLLEELWNQCYPDLYEEDCADPKTFVDARNRVLTACSGDGFGHRRLVRMALTFCSAVAATVDAYLPGDPRPARVIARLEEWLEDPATHAGEDLLSMFPQVPTPPQALHEALDVLYQSLKALDPASTVDALQEILDDCVEGYAIFPGSDGRRDLFNWWLIEVVPASWCLRKPDVIYTMGLPWPPSGAHGR
jgi:hypothetical protein